MKKALLPILLLGFNFLVTAQVSFTKDIASIVYNKCANCHRPGEIGPFSLTNYEEVRSYGETIKFVTGIKYMPPWKADPSYQHFLEENFLSDEQIKAISDWVDNGMPYGNAAEEPSFPDYPEGSTLGVPDLVLRFATKHEHKGNSADEYRYFVLPTGLTENKRIKAIELRPGNKRIVHHALFFQDTTGKARGYDAQTPEYGFPGNTSGFDVNSVLLYEQYPGYVPGQKPIRYPESIGQKMNKNADLVIQMHYAPTPVTEYDSSTVNIFFADDDEQIDRYVTDKIMLPNELPGGFGSFFIPANQKKTFTGRWKTTKDVSFLSVFPHMHLLGKRWKVWLERPDGSKENLIKIDDWDFNWQGGYYFTRLIVAPKGSTVVAEAEYDNTTNNPLNPNNPPKLVFWGEKTSDEMYYLPLLHIPYKPGDENIVFDETTGTKDPVHINPAKPGLNISPNPATGELVNVSFNLPEALVLNISLHDASGKFVRFIREAEFFTQGINYVHLDASSITTGNWYVKIEGRNLIIGDKLTIIK
ncbi:MAG: cytochrome c [Saprospiraceae bacterium]|nr:cytochrome c [Saprospiraceae bacterium]